MRLGSYECALDPESLSHKAYNRSLVYERHRHRYEFNNAFKIPLEKAGLRIAGTCPENHLVEIIEVKDHPWMVGVQYHPEFISRPTEPQVLFTAFVNAATKGAAPKGSQCES